MSVNETLVEAKMCKFTLDSTHFIFNKCPIYTHDGASAKFSTNSHETDYSVDCLKIPAQLAKEVALQAPSFEVKINLKWFCSARAKSISLLTAGIVDNMYK